MSESNSSNLPDAANDSLGQNKSDVTAIDNMTSALASTSIMSGMGETAPDKFLPPASFDRCDSGTISMPSLSSFDGLATSSIDGDDDLASYDDDEDVTDFDESYDDEDDDEIIQGDLVRNAPIAAEPRPMPVIPGLEVSKDARPGTFLAELAISADSLVNKRTPEKELGARWKDGSIPIAKLVKQKKGNKKVQMQMEENEDKQGRGRRISGRRRLRSKSPPPPIAGIQEDVQSDDDGEILMSFSEPPLRPVRQASVELPPMSPLPLSGVISPHGAFASMSLPIKPERKISVGMLDNMTGDFLSSSTHSAGEQSNVGLSPDDVAEEGTPPIQPMRQTTRNMYDRVVETIEEDDNPDDDEEDDCHPTPNDDSPSLPQRRETMQDAALLDPDDKCLGELRYSEHRNSLIDDSQSESHEDFVTRTTN
ncbi:unnamed protein product [Cylindrotheca closterium]|uniref:Uncharacterized protein n=1 Tax=Cylindrotheca closterium TaxID=2856 RepID=A0AAD2FMK5_9STRA|nr:unnamed protein product [Cylindrotheca closterium]